MQLAVVASASNTFFNWSIWRWRLVLMPSDGWSPFFLVKTSVTMQCKKQANAKQQ